MTRNLKNLIMMKKTQIRKEKEEQEKEIGEMSRTTIN
jgi:hypothetical protein